MDKSSAIPQRNHTASHINWNCHKAYPYTSTRCWTYATSQMHTYGDLIRLGKEFLVLDTGHQSKVPK